jgi:hypothetical protein
MTAKLDPELPEQLSGQSAASHPRRRFARRSAFKNIPEVARVVFQTSGQISMTRTRAFDSSGFLRRQFLRRGGHYLSPVGPILVINQHCQRRAERQTMPDTAKNLDAIRFDLHARAAAITLLSAFELVIYLLDVDGHACGQTFDYRDQGATMGFA